MRFVCTAGLSLLGLVCLSALIPPTVSAQATTTASKGAEIYAFGGYEAGKTDYGAAAKSGFAAGAGFTVFPRFLVAPSFEIRADEAKGSDATEKTVVAVIRGQLDLHDRWERFHPYAEFAFGGGEIIYHPDPYADYTGDRSRVIGYGGGVNIDIAHHVGAKVDFQARQWNLGSNTTLAPGGTFTLAPQVLLVGVTYTVPFRKLNRQGDFR